MAKIVPAPKHKKANICESMHDVVREAGREMRRLKGIKKLRNTDAIRLQWLHLLRVISSGCFARTPVRRIFLWSTTNTTLS